MLSRPRQTRVLGIGIVALTLAGASVAAERWKLRFDPAEGQTYRYTMTQRQDMTISMGALGEQQGQSIMQAEVTHVITDKARDGAVTMESRFVNLTLDSDFGGQKTRFDSDGNAPEGPLAAMGALIGKPLTVRLSSRGEVLSVAGFDGIWDATLPAGDPASAPILELVRESFDDEAMKAMFQQFGAVYPQKAIRAGDDWTFETSLTNPLLGRIDMVYAYRVGGSGRGAADRCVQLAFDVAMSYGGSNPMLERLQEVFRQQGAEIDLDWKIKDSKGSGSVCVDPRTGFPRSLEADNALAVDVTVGMTLNGQTQRLPVNMKIDIHTTLEPLN